MSNEDRKMYIKHPVSQKVISELQSKGYKIIDLKFKPELLLSGDEVYSEQKETKRKRKTKAAQ